MSIRYLVTTFIACVALVAFLTHKYRDDHGPQPVAEAPIDDARIGKLASQAANNSDELARMSGDIAGLTVQLADLQVALDSGADRYADEIAEIKSQIEAFAVKLAELQTGSGEIPSVINDG